MFSGSIVALVTPFSLSNTIDFKKLAELIEYHVLSSTDALLILGTTGESTSLNEYEKDRLVEFVINQNNMRMKILVGVITNNTLDAVKKSIKYEKMGADGLLLIPPFYNKTNKEGLINHFKLIAYSVKIPIILYNIPSRTGINLDIDILKELKKISNIVGVKEANKDITHIMDLASICDSKFHLYCGNDELSYLFLSLGAKGLINVYGNVEANVIKDLINIYEINPTLAYNYFKDYYELFKLIFIEINPIPIKSLMNYLGFDVGEYRLPLYKMNDENYNKMILEYNNTLNRLNISKIYK